MESGADRKTQLYHRLVGVAVIAAVIAIAVPLMLDFRDADPPAAGAVIPPKPPGLRVEEISLAPARPAGPTTDVPASNAPAATAPSDARSAPQGWAVKVGSFSSEENAVSLRNQLRSKGYSAFVEKTSVEGKALLRVYVGPDVQKSRSEQLRERLAREFNLPEAVVVGYN